MRDTNDFPEKPNDDHLVIAQAGDSYWLLDGEPHFSAMLSGLGPYPTPIQCVMFTSVFHLTEFLQAQGTELSALWGINPAIITRLERKDEIVQISPVDAA
ncbi:hypothetical protein [Parasulfitobacter algicola]|uniref:Uncharacterized protein n=1 Tax=Parasulfitobacter algicola TaxID=2614809 RepID=A0ABX2IMD1_9RHOB|nr:hypothetical protein [Sulfitobacter algicola]NSX53685.1 hypothetical protein [Sulfitobacter algicola]